MGSKYTRLTLYLGTESKKYQILTLYMVQSNCPDDSKKVKQLYVDLMLLVISLLTLLMSVGGGDPPYINPICD